MVEEKQLCKKNYFLVVYLRSLASRAFLRALPASEQCSLVTDCPSPNIELEEASRGKQSKGQQLLKSNPGSLRRNHVFTNLRANPFPLNSILSSFLLVAKETNIRSALCGREVLRLTNLIIHLVQVFKATFITISFQRKVNIPSQGDNPRFYIS